MASVALLLSYVLIFSIFSFSFALSGRYPFNIPQNSISPERLAEVQNVIVIGAGMAGISAATRLMELGVPNVQILEARKRLGGRLWTENNTFGIPIDIGGAWIHGPENNPISMLADEFGNLPRVVTDDNSLVRFDQLGNEYSDAAVAASDISLSDWLQLVAADSESLGWFDPDTDLANMLLKENQTAWAQIAMQWQLGSNLEFDSGTAIERLSLKYWADDGKYAGEDVVLPGGYCQLLDNWVAAKRLPISYDTFISNVLSDPNINGVMLTARDGRTFLADAVVVTVPLSILQRELITFAPPLPDDKVKALGRLQLGVTNKIILQFESVFWDPTVTYFGYDYSEQPSLRGKLCYWLNYHKYVGHNVLIGFGFGQYAIDMESQSNSQILDDVMAALKIMFGRDTLPPLTNFYISRWGQDPFAFGTYTSSPPGSHPNDYTAVMDPLPGNRVFFAGEHTNHDARGTVHGAYWSGQIAAAQLTQTEVPSPGYPPSSTPGPVTPPTSAAQDLQRRQQMRRQRLERMARLRQVAQQRKQKASKKRNSKARKSSPLQP